MSHTNFSLIIDTITPHRQSGIFLFKDTVFEAASTAKLFIVCSYLEMIQGLNIPLKTTYVVDDEHIIGTDSWSGKKKWSKRTYTASELVHMCLVDSDAVATNVILASIGSKEGFNNYLESSGFLKTRLMRPSFAGESLQGKKFIIAITSANDCRQLLYDIFIRKSRLNGKYYKLMRRSMGRVPIHGSENTTHGLIFHHKTGTSLSGKKLTINDAGVVFSKETDDIPSAIIIFLTTQTFTSWYHSDTFISRLERFDKKILGLINRVSM